MDAKMEVSWKAMLNAEFEKPYFQELVSFVKEEYQTHSIFPPENKLFAAFDHCELHDLKVVILGQDPYHGDGQANGLCFSVSDGIKSPPSLVNIFKEIQDDLGIPIPKNGNLERWATQGVLLLNATLTVRANEPGSHQNRGWEQFTDEVIRTLSNSKENLVFILWGAFAQKKEALIDAKKHFILKAAHPSPFSAYKGFLGCGHFSKTNDYLNKLGLKEIVW